MHALVGALYPGKEELRHSRVRLDAVRERVVDGFVPADVEPALPGALYERIWRCDQEKEIDDLTEPRQQIAARLVRIGGEAIETEPIDEQVRHVSALGLSRHVMIELLIDDLQLFAREHGSILIDRAESVVVEQLFAPDVRTDKRKVAPTYTDVACEPPLQRTQGALARGRRPLRIHNDWPCLPRQQAVAFAPGRIYEPRLDQPADFFARQMVARHVGDK